MALVTDDSEVDDLTVVPDVNNSVVLVDKDDFEVVKLRNSVTENPKEVEEEYTKVVWNGICSRI